MYQDLINISEYIAQQTIEGCCKCKSWRRCTWLPCVNDCCLILWLSMYEVLLFEGPYNRMDGCQIHTPDRRLLPPSSFLHANSKVERKKVLVLTGLRLIAISGNLQKQREIHYHKSLFRYKLYLCSILQVIIQTWSIHRTTQTSAYYMSHPHTSYWGEPEQAPH